jgi:SAM-dependent methyltransferase
MHETSLVTMGKVAWKHGLDAGKVVVDVGSYNYNGTYRHLVEAGGSRYVGADVTPGPNVDVIVGSQEWDALKDIDAVISGQTFEHVEDPAALLGQIHCILKAGGILCVITPSAGPAHDAPKWYRNYTEEGLRLLIETAGFEMIESKVNPIGEFHDLCCVAKKKVIHTEAYHVVFARDEKVR